MTGGPGAGEKRSYHRPECGHLEDAARALAKSIFYNQGQICSAPSRLIVESSIMEEVLRHLLRQSPHYQPADG